MLLKHEVVPLLRAVRHLRVNCEHGEPIVGLCLFPLLLPLLSTEILRIGAVLLLRQVSRTVVGEEF